MANPFLGVEHRDIETALLLEQAIVHDIGKAVAFTDGNRVFVNTDDNLFNILPDYNHDMLKWLLWHERFHKELSHHTRYFKYLRDLDYSGTIDTFHVTKEEVNIIMDILVHDSLCKMFPELIETAVKNLAQMRESNSLKYTFKTFTLEEMLKEYAEHKKDPDETPDGKSSDDDGDGTSGEDDKKEDDTKDKSEKSDDSSKDEDTDKKDTKGHSEGSSDEKSSEDEKPEDGEPEIKDGGEPPEQNPIPSHDERDWSKLDDQDSTEFIDTYRADEYIDEINELRHKKIKLGKITETLNGLVTTTRRRSYTMPSTIHIGGGVLLKGSTPGRAQLYLVFDASGSMGAQLATFKDIISRSIPQAMETPTAWFSGYGERISPDPNGRSRDYYKGKFRDIMPVRADDGYSDDGDRTIELCWLAEQQGYSPIGVTDGGGQIDWSKPLLKQLKRTILVGQNPHWLKEAQKINPKVQVLDI